jgi:hypothetical protein
VPNYGVIAERDFHQFLSAGRPERDIDTVVNLRETVKRLRGISSLAPDNHSLKGENALIEATGCLAINLRDGRSRK